ncbi:hypothetical protein D9M70_434460 [compost metagenome]
MVRPLPKDAAIVMTMGNPQIAPTLYKVLNQEASSLRTERPPAMSPMVRMAMTEKVVPATAPRLETAIAKCRWGIRLSSVISKSPDMTPFPGRR